MHSSSHNAMSNDQDVNSSGTSTRHDPALADFMSDSSQTDITGPWWCPVCETPTPHRYRAGRQKVYCTNACRQKAYRWRRAHAVRLFATADSPAERAENRWLRHALRDPRDPVANLQTPRGREVTVCGTFARPARNQRVRHARFLPASTNACKSCIQNIGIDPNTFLDAPEFTFNTPEFWAHVEQTANVTQLQRAPRPSPPSRPSQRPHWPTTTPHAA